MSRRPLSVTLVGWLFIAAGARGLANHAGDQLALGHVHSEDQLPAAPTRDQRFNGNVLDIHERIRCPVLHGDDLLHAARPASEPDHEPLF